MDQSAGAVALPSTSSVRGVVPHPRQAKAGLGLQGSCSTDNSGNCKDDRSDLVVLNWEKKKE